MNELLELAARSPRGNAVDAEWTPRDEETSWRTAADPGAALATLASAVATASASADLDAARYALWLALPVLRDDDLPAFAAITPTLRDPNARLLALFLLLGRAASAPPWWVEVARPALAAIAGRTARTMETILENVRRAVDEPARFERQAGLHAGARLFNDAQYFEAHEVWEDVWRPQRGPERDFFRGLINLAVAMNKAKEGNPNGVIRLVERADGMLAPFAPAHRGLDVTWLRERMAGLRTQAQAWQAGSRDGIDPAAIPRLPEA